MVHLQLDQIKKNAIDENIPIMQDAGINFISNYIKENNIKSVLEIGTAVGYSAMCFALSGAKVTTIERDIERYNKAISNIRNCQLDDKVKVINADALDINLLDKYDLIFIDAAKSQYIKFFEKFKNNLNTNGVIISDNLSFHGMVDDISLTHNRNTRQLVGKIKRYIDFLKNNVEFTTTFYKIGDGISVSKRNFM